MAEALAVAASVIAVIQITDRIVSVCRSYIKSVKDAPHDLHVILLEISTLKTIFEDLEFLSSCPIEVSTAVGTLYVRDGPITGCHKSIMDLEKMFPSSIIQGTGPNRNKEQKTKATLAALAWPLRGNKARKLLDEILQYKSTIMFVLTTENTYNPLFLALAFPFLARNYCNLDVCFFCRRRDIKDLKRQTSGIRRALNDVQRQNCLQWLLHTDPSPFHNQARKKFEPETGKWILRLPEWSDWLKSKKRCLWLHGLPGAGKTVLISNLIEQTQKHCDESPETKSVCVYYYFYFGHNRDETLPFLQWILTQLCRLADLVPDSAYGLYTRGVQPDVADLLEAIADSLADFQTVFVVVDAVDESRPRDDLLKVLKDLVTDSRLQKIQLLASSREYIDIERTMHTISVPVPMTNSHVEEDIRIHIRSVLQVNPHFNRWPSQLLAEVETAVSKGARGMFRWAVCQIDALQRLKAEHSVVREALADLPLTLEETYDRILLMVPEEEQILVRHALQWIRYHGELRSGEGIPIDILVQAVVKSTSAYNKKLTARYHDIEIIRELCGCLINVIPQEVSCHRGQVTYTSLGVSFAHFTVQEYLDSSRTTKSSTAFSATCKLTLWPIFTALVFEEAYQVQMNELWEWAKPCRHVQEAVSAVEKDFNTYSVACALLSYSRWMAEISQMGDVRAFFYDFVNPVKYHYKAMEKFAGFLENQIEYFRLNTIDDDRTGFWDTERANETNDADASLFFNLCHLTRPTLWFPDGQMALVEGFMEGRNAGTLFQASMKFERCIPMRDEFDVFSFDGRLIEVLASLPLLEDWNFLRLLEYESELSDPSALLFAYTGRHDEICKNGTVKCLMEYFVDRGADPNASEYRITPLQVAAHMWDLRGVRLLLKAGADPNCTGNPDGIIWQKNAFIGRFNYLHGASPLHICWRLYCGYGYSEEFRGYEHERDGNREEIKAELLKYGAQDFVESHYKSDGWEDVEN